MKLAASLLTGLLLAATACGKKSEPAPNETASGPSKTTAEGGVRRSSRTPDWTLDAADPARDYVGRYLRATLRYGTDTACVVLGRSAFRNGESLVEVRSPADGSCGKAGDLRDTFIANVSADRLRLDDPEHRPALKPWPDGSMPDAPPAPVASVADLFHWKAPLHDAIKNQQLYPLRVQLYGRGTYPIITLAGWHALFDPKGDLAALKAPAHELCTATRGAPMGFFAELDRSTLLRIDCPDNPHWEQL
jgi:hypothetical protein